MSWWPKPQRDKEIRWRRRADAKEAARAIESLIEQEGDRRVAIWLRVRLRPEPVTTVAPEYGYRDRSGADRVIKHLEEKANSDRALSRRLKALAKAVSRVDADTETLLHDVTTTNVGLTPRALARLEEEILAKR